ncbi:unnamed protein product [Symbiodinium sp. KB8]|nr:unnamed protein product [Symbiodinium sp. KB8]
MDTAAEACSPAVLIDPRVDVYFELCTRFRVEPCAAVTIALRFPDVSYLQLDSTFGAADLLPLAELLRVRAALRRRPAAPRAMRGCAADAAFRLVARRDRDPLLVGASRPQGGAASGVTTLDLRRCEIGNAGCYVLQHALESAECPLRSLILSYNDIGEHGAIALAKAMWRSRTLERVDLRGNRIGVAGAVALAHVVKSNPALRYLDVSQNNLRIRGVQELHQALQARARRASRRLANATGNGAPKLRQVRRRAADADHPSGDGLRHRRSSVPPGAGAAGGSGSQSGVGSEDDGASTGDDGDIDDFDFEVDDEGGRVGDGGPGEEEALGRIAQSVAQGGIAEGGGRRGAMEGFLDPHLEWDLSQGRVGAEGIRVRWAGNLVNQEITHSIIHGVGLLMAVLGAIPMLQGALTATSVHAASVTVYVAGLVTFYVMATLRHSLFFLESTSRTLRALDHMCIYLLIASTYTPFLSVNLGRTWVGPITLASIWAAALVGALMAWLSGDRITSFKMIMYMGMGWAGIVTARPVMRCVDTGGLYLLLGGGAIYSIGAVFYSVGKRTPTTSRWRWAWYLLAVIASTLHYCAVLWYVADNPGCEGTDWW